ncbi:MAG TPA: hypothetical protein VML54_00725 [Candidatus Limnocylindrales bacterium]|nr:hypothetical protein [Candidatus Limnocylindrales bacterium]
MTDIEHAIRHTSEARKLCLSLKRAFLGPPALERMRAGEAASLSDDALRVGLGLAWEAGEVELMRRAFERLAGARVQADPVLAAFREATR